MNVFDKGWYIKITCLEGRTNAWGSQGIYKFLSCGRELPRDFIDKEDCRLCCLLGEFLSKCYICGYLFFRLGRKLFKDIILWAEILCTGISPSWSWVGDYLPAKLKLRGAPLVGMFRSKCLEVWKKQAPLSLHDKHRLVLFLLMLMLLFFVVF